MTDQSYSQPILTQGAIYTVGQNDGTVFNNIIYVGLKLLNGKIIMAFETASGNQLTINPSYHSFMLEDSGVENESDS